LWAQFIETDCPNTHPDFAKSRLVGSRPLEDGVINHEAPDFYYTEKDGRRIGIIDYRFSEDLIHRNAKLLCHYVGAPDLRVSIPGLLTRCTYVIRERNQHSTLLRMFCESDISPPSEDVPKAGGQ